MNLSICLSPPCCCPSTKNPLSFTRPVTLSCANVTSFCPRPPYDNGMHGHQHPPSVETSKIQRANPPQTAYLVVRHGQEGVSLLVVGLVEPAWPQLDPGGLALVPHRRQPLEPLLLLPIQRCDGVFRRFQSLSALSVGRQEMSPGEGTTCSSWRISRLS